MATSSIHTPVHVTLSPLSTSPHCFFMCWVNGWTQFSLGPSSLRPQALPDPHRALWTTQSVMNARWAPLGTLWTWHMTPALLYSAHSHLSCAVCTHNSPAGPADLNAC
jgi:hypothetical protein